MKAANEQEKRLKAEMLIAYRAFMSVEPHSHKGTLEFGKILGLRAAALALRSVDAMEFGRRVNDRALRACK